jgi:peroxiredoxin
MKTLLIILITSFTAIAVKAQTTGKPVEMPPMPATVIMPDGSRVPSKSMDSIKQVFGGRDIMLSFTDDGVYVHPQKNKAEQLESDKNLNSHLDKLAPGFELKDLNGSACSLANLKGKIVVLNFWFTQCGGCITEMPDLNALKKQYAGKDVVFLAITFDDNAKVKAFLAKNQFDYTIIPNAAQLCKDYNIYGYPTSMVIERTGIVRFINCSIADDIKEQLVKAIDGLLVQHTKV